MTQRRLYQFSLSTASSLCRTGNVESRIHSILSSPFLGSFQARTMWHWMLGAASSPLPRGRFTDTASQETFSTNVFDLVRTVSVPSLSSGSSEPSMVTTCRAIDGGDHVMT